MSEPAVSNQAAPPFSARRVGLLRRLIAMLYDGLLCLAVLFLATAALLPFTDGEAVASGPWWYRVYLLGTAGLYFTWFWTHGGQTLGMKAWKFRVCSWTGEPLTWRAALLRFLGACVAWAPAGMGHLWIVVDRNKLAWHDHWSRSQLVAEVTSGQPPHEPDPHPEKQ